MHKNAVLVCHAVGLGCASLAASSYTFAQAHTAAIEEVIVSTQRRDESLQDVPITIPAFTENTLQDTGVNNIGLLDAIDAFQAGRRPDC
jgi:iron complex outermembrane receptor protein